MERDEEFTYKSAGVDIEASEKAIQLMKSAIESTHNSSVLGGLGMFGAMYRIPGTEIVAVSSTDGVGTRILVGILADRHEENGAALVAHCINDVLAQGARAAFFLDYFASADLIPEIAARVVKGAAEECANHNVALIGGETATMKGFYTEGVYDFVGTMIGFANEAQIITGKDIKHGDLIVGLASDGLHTNGYTLVNELVFETQGLGINDQFLHKSTVGDELLKPHRCYLEAVLPLMQAHFIKGAAHITGGGLPGNLVRPLPEGCRAYLDPKSWVIPPIFEWIKKMSNQSVEDWRRTFNLGIGFCLIVRETEISVVLNHLATEGEQASIIGEIREGERGVEFI